MQITYWLQKVLKMISLCVNTQKCIDVQGDHFHLHLFNFLYRVRDLRPRWSARWRAGFSCATLYMPKEKCIPHTFNNYVT